MVTIVLAHPWHGSFNKKIMDTITEKYDKTAKEYQIIDLNKDNFNPVMTEADLIGYSKGTHVDALVGKYQEMLMKTSEIIFIYPIWWMTEPAILKGFFDKVMLLDFAFNYTNGWTTLLNHITKAVVITTSEQATDNFVSLGDPINDFILNSLNSTGISNAVWINCDHVSSAPDAHRIAFLEKVTVNI